MEDRSTYDATCFLPSPARGGVSANPWQRGNAHPRPDHYAGKPNSRHGPVSPSRQTGQQSSARIRGTDDGGALVIDLVALAAIFGMILVVAVILLVGSRRHAELDWNNGGPPGAGTMLGGG